MPAANIYIILWKLKYEDIINSFSQIKDSQRFVEKRDPPKVLVENWYLQQNKSSPHEAVNYEQ